MIRLLATTVAAAFLSAALPAQAVGRLVDVSIVDRDTGRTLQPIAYRGQWWVAGRPGARYRIVLAARDGRRTLDVVSVDGVNAITGDTAAWNQTGYVVEPYDTFGVDGWRKNAAQVAAFTFAALPDSYAVRTGRPANVGVIGVAVFDERPPVVHPRVDASLRAEPVAPASDGAPPPAPSQGPVPAPAPSRSPRPDAASAKGDATAAMPEARERLGTGHGAIESSAIVYVPFERARSTPSEVVTIHYDRLENLIAMGIVPSRSATNADGDPFPDSRRYVPDPPPR